MSQEKKAAPMSDKETSISIPAIAIVGMSGRFPGAPNIDTFWQHLCDGVESVSFFSDQELLSSGVDHAVLSQPNYVKARAILEDAEWLDAAFFGYTPREAEFLDPQHRLLLQCAWEALENAGYDSEKYPGSIGVFAGVGMNHYLLRLASNRDLIVTIGDFQAMIGNDRDFLTTRISYKLNLTGPSITVQTACSTSLVAVCLACQSLLNYQCDMALAGGVSVHFPQESGYFYQEGGIFSPDGHCRAFDAKAQGTVPGSGAGIVVLKRLEDALAEGDQIRAIIKGFALNNDGSFKVGYTAPSVDKQAEVIVTAQVIAGVPVETITYVETHGTATPLGDPIEIAALTRAFRINTGKKGFCAIGSVKTNIGHLDAAAGVAGLIKPVLALKHKMIPPSLHFEQPNPEIDFANSPFYVNTTLSEWKTDGIPRRAGVSSFGMGGTNAHVVLEEAPVVEVSGESRPWHLCVLSAKTSSALETMTANLAEHLSRHPDLNLADVAYTYQIGRRAFNHRRFVVCKDVQDAIGVLQATESERVFTATCEAAERPIAFMLSGQGAQYVNMGRELYKVELTFRQQIDRCAELLHPHLGLDLRNLLYPGEEQTEEATQQLQQTWITQPALFVIEYALARLWMEWGVRPQAMIGHSIGEYVAACLAGVFSLEDALALVARRGQMMQNLPPGAMLSIPLPEEKVRPLLGNTLSLASVNEPARCVISGPIDAIDASQSQLAEQGVNCRRLHTSHAFHSAMMDPILGPFIDQVKRVDLQPPQIPYVSNVTGTWITAAEATDPSYWARHLRQTVRFADGLKEMLRDTRQVLLEIGPGWTLYTFARGHPSSTAEHVILSSLRHPREQVSDVAFLLTTLGELCLAGVRIDWSGFYIHERRCRLPLPTYPFERKRYWIEGLKTGEPRMPETEAVATKPLPSASLPGALYTSTQGEEAAVSAGLERIITKQIEVMSQQLDTLLTEET
jgi:acyl transferase domain-containing protein